MLLVTCRGGRDGKIAICTQKQKKRQKRAPNILNSEKGFVVGVVVVVVKATKRRLKRHIWTILLAKLLLLFLALGYKNRIHFD